MSVSESPSSYRHSKSCEKTQCAHGKTDPAFELLDIDVYPMQIPSQAKKDHTSQQDASSQKYASTSSFFGWSFLVASFFGLVIGASLAFLLISGTLTLSHKEVQGFFAKIQKVNLLLK